MAEVLGKTSLISSWNSNRQHHHRRISLVPKNLNCNSGFPCAVRRFPSLKLKSQVLRSSSSSTQSQFYGRKIVFHVIKGIPYRGISLLRVSTAAQMGLRYGKAQRWWEKGLQPNMREVTSAQDLVDSLLNAGNKLVIVDFFTPGCSGCKALHPKICQFAEMNPDVQFLQVNYEEHKPLCDSLCIRVFPFFRFYRGANGRLCSFSCTNATIKKFKDALAKHTPDRCSLRPTKGLEEKELLALSANKELSFTYTPKPVQPVHDPSAQEELPAEAAQSPHAPAPEELVAKDVQSPHVPTQEELTAEDAPAPPHPSGPHPLIPQDQEELTAGAKAEAAPAPSLSGPRPLALQDQEELTAKAKGESAPAPPPPSGPFPLAPQALKSSEVSKEGTLITAGR